MGLAKARHALAGANGVNGVNEIANMVTTVPPHDAATKQKDTNEHPFYTG